MVVIDNTIVNVALPTLSAELDASTTELQWIVDAYTLVFAALLLAFGHFGDRFGRKLALQLGLVIFAATSLLAAMSTTSTQLIGARALMGIGAAFVFPATLADPRQRLHRHARARGGHRHLVGLHRPRRRARAGHRRLPARALRLGLDLPRQPAPRRRRARGRVASSCPTSRDPQDAAHWTTSASRCRLPASALLVWSIIEAPASSAGRRTRGRRRHGRPSPCSPPSRCGSGASPHPLLDVTLFRNARFTAASVSVTAAFFALFGFIFLITQYLQLVQGYSPLEAGLRTLPFADRDRRHVAARDRGHAPLGLEGRRRRGTVDHGRRLRDRRRSSRWTPPTSASP